MATVTTRGASARTSTMGPTSPRAGNLPTAGDGNPPGPPGPPGPGGLPGGGGGGPPGGVGGPPGGPPGAAVPPQQAFFALTPARAVQGLIDYTTRHRQRLYEMAIQSLEPNSVTDLFGLQDCEESQR